VAVLGGQFSLARLVPALPEGPTSIRLLATIAAAAALWPWRMRIGIVACSRPLIVLYLLCAYLVVRGAIADGPSYWTKAVDVVYLVALSGLTAIAAGLPMARRGAAAAIVICATVVLALEIRGKFAIFSDEPPRFGFGWDGILGPITFNRIQFLSFVVILCVLGASTPRADRRFLGICALASVFLFGVLGSLQKAPIAGAGCALTAIAAYLLVKRDYVQAAVVLGVTLVAILLAVQVFGVYIQGRLESTVKLSATAGREPVVRLAQVGGTADTKVVVDVPAVPGGSIGAGEGSFATVKLRYCYFKSATLRERAPGTPVICYERLMVDGTGRIALAAEAIRGIASHPILGQGLGSYRVMFIHPENHRLSDVYTYPHNLLLEIAFEGGIVGLVLLLVAAGMLGVAAARASVLDRYRVPLLGFAVYMAVTTMFSGDFYDSRLLWLAPIVILFWTTFEGDSTIEYTHGKPKSPAV